MDQGLSPALSGRWRFAAHLGIISVDRPLLAHSAGSTDPVVQIERAHALGFAGITDNGLKLRPAETQRRMASALARLGMEMGTFTHNPMVGEPPFFWGAPIADIEAALAPTLATAERMGGCVNLILLDAGLPAERQRAVAVANFRAAVKVARRRGARLALESVSRQRMPQALLDSAAATASIVREVGEQQFGLILDSCHMAHSGDDIGETIKANADILAAIQIADVPGRVEPGAGDIDFVALAAALDRIGWRGLVEAEFDISRANLAGEKRAIDALARFGQ